MKTAVLLSLSALALAAPTPSGHKVAFARRNTHVTNEDGSVDGQWLLGQIKYTLRKYNKDYVLPDFLENAKTVHKRSSIPLTDQTASGIDELYYGTGYVGAAAQAFTFDFDTGSSDTFIPGPSCGKAQGCTGTTKYNQKGTDEHNTTTITYGSGEVTGENYFDTLTVAGLKATHQNIISLTSASGFSTSQSEGLLGLAFESIAQSEQPPYFFTLISEKQIPAPEFSFYLGRAASGTAKNSELTLGGRDSSKYTGATTQVPVTSQTYWEVQVATANVNNSAVALTNSAAAIDTGTTVVIAPTTDATAIYAAIPGSILLPLEGGATEQVFAYPCASNPQVGFTMGGKNFVINPLDFNLGAVTLSSSLPVVGTVLADLLGDATSSYCIGGVIGANINPTSPLYVIGDTFLKNWYSTFQYVSSTQAFVNFAKAV